MGIPMPITMPDHSSTLRQIARHTLCGTAHMAVSCPAIVHMCQRSRSIFVVLWLLGSISSFTMGGLLHVFLIVAIVMMAPRVIQGRKARKY